MAERNQKDEFQKVDSKKGGECFTRLKPACEIGNTGAEHKTGEDNVASLTATAFGERMRSSRRGRNAPLEFRDTAAEVLPVRTNDQPLSNPMATI
jgi:hypothetical protein